MYICKYINNIDVIKTYRYRRASLAAQSGKNLPAVQETRVRSLGWEDPLEKEMATHSSILAWRHGQRSLAGYSPWRLKESDTTEGLVLQNRCAVN